jgi:hypothetical protein
VRKRGPVDLRDVRPVAEDLVARINGITILLDPDFAPVKLYAISYETPNGAGASSFGEWRPNKGMTFLGHHPSQLLMAAKTLPLSKTDSVVHLVLDAIALPLRRLKTRSLLRNPQVYRARLTVIRARI